MRASGMCGTYEDLENLSTWIDNKESLYIGKDCVDDCTDNLEILENKRKKWNGKRKAENVEKFIRGNLTEETERNQSKGTTEVYSMEL